MSPGLQSVAVDFVPTHGVLIKGGLYVELPSRLKALAMDKTGTLTEGWPRVVELVPMRRPQTMLRGTDLDACAESLPHRDKIAYRSATRSR
jgi:cation transport ATPase